MSPARFSFLLAIVVGIMVATVSGFTGTPRQTFRRASTELGMTKLNYNGKIVEFKEGSPLKGACAKLGIKPKYSCKKGDCGSCTISIGGSRIKPCVGKVPPQPRLKSLQEKGLPVKWVTVGYDISTWSKEWKLKLGNKLDFWRLNFWNKASPATNEFTNSFVERSSQ